MRGFSERDIEALVESSERREPSSLEEIRETAFAKWLTSQPNQYAKDYLFDCLRRGGSDNAAWGLWEAVHGSQSFPPSKMDYALGKMVEALR